MAEHPAGRLRREAGAPLRASGATAAPPTWPDGGRALYVEDDPGSARLMQRLFALRPGWEFCHADSGASALQSLDQTDPDLILLDLGLPDTHGLVVLNQLRGLARRRDCPVYVVSAQQDPAIKRALVGAGADGFFDKPVAVQAVLDLLDLLAGNRREQQA